MTSSRVITIPNFLTVVRMVMIPVFVSLLFYGRFGWALAVFVSAGATDALDGFLARHFNQKSQVGAILDPIADKLLLVTSFIVLSLPAVYPQPVPRHLPVPFWVTSLVLSRDVFIIVGSITINIVTGFRRFRPSLPGKINTVVQIFAILIVLICSHETYLSGYLLPTTYMVTAAFALFSGVHYPFHASKIMNEARQETEQDEQ